MVESVSYQGGRKAYDAPGYQELAERSAQVLMMAMQKWGNSRLDDRRKERSQEAGLLAWCPAPALALLAVQMFPPHPMIALSTQMLAMAEIGS